MITINFTLLISLFFLLVSSGYGIEDRVYDGQDLRPDENKHLVKLDIVLKDELKSCSGSIIDKFWIVSAAHCFINVQKVEVFHHVNLKKQIATSNYIVKHPHFDEKTVVNNIITAKNSQVDIAMVKTINHMQFNAYIQPVTLGHFEPVPGQVGIIAGFGLTENGLPGSREGSVRISKCFINNGYVICTKGKVQGRSGDSGGSLTAAGELVGITSSYYEKNKETYYASIYDNLLWIYEVFVTHGRINK
ncbi:kallikrein-15-like [Aphomia sociella]